MTILTSIYTYPHLMTCGSSIRPTLLHLHLPHYIYIKPQICPPWGHIRGWGGTPHAPHPTMGRRVGAEAFESHRSKEWPATRWGE
jgi:hypothetical protein